MSASTSYPYIVAAIIAAIPSTLSATAAWKQTQKNREEERTDHIEVEGQLSVISAQIMGVSADISETNARVAQMDLKVDNLRTAMDVRFDAVEDKVERHLDWHRVKAEDGLRKALEKESSGDNPTNQNPAIRQDESN